MDWKAAIVSDREPVGLVRADHAGAPPAEMETGVQAVVRPLALRVTWGMWVESPQGPVLELTVARVRVAVPAADVASPEKAGRRPAGRVPELMLDATRALVVADAANADPPVALTVRTPVVVFKLPSPLTVKPPKAPELLYCTWPLLPPGVPEEPATVWVVQAVARPLASRVMMGKLVVEPQTPTFELTVESVRTPVAVDRVASPVTVKPPKVPEALY
jgi:hypothetical protein